TRLPADACRRTCWAQRHGEHRETRRTERGSTMQPFETLESRQMMDATSPFTINGTAGNDVIVVNYSPPPVLTLARTRAFGRFAGDIFGRSTLTEITVNGVKTTA